jgi:hypothetical protein
MTYSNPHLRMRWQDLAPCLLDDDFHEIVERLRVIYPDLVLFARGFHFPDHREPRYATMPIRFYKDYLSFVADPWVENGVRPFGLALRVPWPEDIASGDPERLIGGRKRYAYEDDVAGYRKYGRTMYLGGAVGRHIVSANKQLIAEIAGIDVSLVPDVRYFRGRLARSSIEFLYNADDADYVDFVRNVRRSTRGLTTSVEASYDVLTGEPLHAFPSRPTSLRWFQRIALEDNLYTGPSGYSGQRVEFMGPHPKLVKKYRLEAGLSYLPKTDLQSIKTLQRAELMARIRAEGSKRLPDSIGPD